MNLSRTLRFAITKLVRFWTPVIDGMRSCLEKIAYILEPLTKLPKSKNKQCYFDKQNAHNQPTLHVGEGGQENNQNTDQCHHNVTCWERIERFIRVCELFAFIAVVLAMLYARKQAVASEGQLQEMQNSRNLDERAWVAPIPDEIRLLPSGTSYYFTLPIKNTGKTPAFNFTGTINMTYDVGSVPLEDKRPSVQGVVLAPDGKTSTNFPIESNLAKMLISPTLGQQVVVFLYGTIWYEDIAGKKHWTQFCYAATGVPNDDLGRLKIDGTSVHNGCDSEIQ